MLTLDESVIRDATTNLASSFTMWQALQQKSFAELAMRYHRQAGILEHGQARIDKLQRDLSGKRKYIALLLQEQDSQDQRIYDLQTRLAAYRNVLSNYSKVNTVTLQLLSTSHLNRA